MHPRKAIRAAFKARLLNATACQDRVFATMTPPVDLNGVLSAEGPVMLIYLRHEEEREEDYPADRQDGAFRRRMEVTIEVLAVGAEVDDLLDDIAEEIEALLENWEVPGFPAVDPLLMSSQIDVTDAQDRILGGLFMGYHLKAWSPYRADTSPGWIPTEVFVKPQAPAPSEEIIFNPDVP
jgi:hypothetical protein